MRIGALLRNLVMLLALHAAVIGADMVQPGKEGPLVVPGASKDCVLYIPTDYARNVPTPLILFMHGAGGSPTTWPFRQATDGAGYIICGLSYGAFANAGASGIPTDPANGKLMMDFIAKVREQIGDAYNVDQRQVILSGLSMGGWGVNFFGLQTSQKGLYCGYAIIAAGAMDNGTDLTVAAGLPVLVLNGETCMNLPQATSGMAALTRAGADAKQVVLKGQGHVPSQDAIIPPLRLWLEGVKHHAERSATTSALHWHDGTITGAPEPGGDPKAAITHLLGNQPGLGLVDGEPALIFLADPPSSDPTWKHGADTTTVDTSVFSWPGATTVPVAAHDFTAIRIDVIGIAAQDDRLINRDAAPAVILLDRNHACVAFLKGRSQLSESAVFAAMRPLLTADQRGAVDHAIAAVKPLLKTMRAVQGKLDQAIARQTQMRISGGDTATEERVKDEVDDLDRQIRELRDQLAVASVPATAGAPAAGSAPATSGAPALH